MIKKAISFICCLSLLLVSIPIFAQDINILKDNDYEKYGERNIEQDQNEKDNFKRTIEKLKKRNKFIEKFSKTNNTGLKSATSETWYSTYCPNYIQETTYWCGPATGLQTIGNWEMEDEVLNNPTKQAQLAKDMETTSSGTNIYKCRDAINIYLPWEYYVSSTIKNNTTSKEDLQSNSLCDIVLDYHTVVYLVIKNRLSYYAGTSSSGHYISGYGYLCTGDFSTDKIGLMDCHYSSKYSGSHKEPFNNVFKGLYDYYYSRGVSNFLW